MAIAIRDPRSDCPLSLRPAIILPSQPNTETERERERDEEVKRLFFYYSNRLVSWQFKASSFGFWSYNSNVGTKI